MGKYNELLTLRNKIENTLNYQLSLSNLELYHSNLFAVVLEKSGFINHKFFGDVIDINKKYTDLKVYREKKLDWFNYRDSWRRWSDSCYFYRK